MLKIILIYFFLIFLSKYVISMFYFSWISTMFFTRWLYVLTSWFFQSNFPIIHGIFMENFPIFSMIFREREVCFKWKHFEGLERIDRSISIVFSWNLTLFLMIKNSSLKWFNHDLKTYDLILIFYWKKFTLEIYPLILFFCQISFHLKWYSLS